MLFRTLAEPRRGRAWAVAVPRPSGVFRAWPGSHCGARHRPRRGHRTGWRWRMSSAMFWGQLFDHVNLEEDMMHAYVGTRDESQRASFAPDDRRRRAPSWPRCEAPETLAERVMGATGCRCVRVVHRRAEGRAGRGPDGGSGDSTATGAVRRGGNASTGLGEHVQRTAGRCVPFQTGALDAESETGPGGDPRLPSRSAWHWLAVCLAVLLGYQRRVERQAASHRHDFPARRADRAAQPDRCSVKRTDAAMRAARTAR